MQDIETYSYDFYDETPPQGWLRRHAGQLVLAFGIIAAILATGITGIYSNDIKLAAVYLLACATCFGFLFVCREDILSPIGIATIWYIFGFLLSVPFYTASKQLNDVAPSSAAFTRTVGLSLVGLWAFAIGTISGFQIIFRPIFRWITQTKRPLRPSGHGQFILVLIWLLLGAAIRLYFSVGRAAVESIIRIADIAGIVQFAFNDGSLILIGLFLYRSFERSKLFLMEGYILLIGYSVAQLLLGWKGAILGALLMFITVLWYQRGEQRHRSLMWALILVLFIPATMQIGYSVRAQETGVSKTYAADPTEFLLKTVTRLDGNARFAKVLEYETRGQGISLTNGFKIIPLIRSGMPTVQYADFYVHGIAPEQRTSAGASGPGGAYIALGLSGIIVGYFLLGAVYRSIHNLVKNFSDPTLAIVLYGLMVYILVIFLAENFGVDQFIKRIFIVAIILILSRLLLRGGFHENSQMVD